MDDNEPTCRICLDPTTPDELSHGDAFELGCSCGGGKDAVHSKCAEQWFTIRRNTTCEVCGSEAKGVPMCVKQSIIRDGGDTVSCTWCMNLHRMPRSLREVAAWYGLFCLMPACASAIFLATFYNRVMAADIATTIAISTLISTCTMLQWLSHMCRTTLHVLFVTVVTLIVMNCTLLYDQFRADDDCQAWKVSLICIAGALTGLVCAFALYYGAILPWALRYGNHQDLFPALADNIGTNFRDPTFVENGLLASLSVDNSAFIVSLFSISVARAHRSNGP